jgi:hypothetical protein
VYEILQGLHVLRTLAVVFIWKKAKDPATSQIKLEIFYGVWLFMVEAAWLIYGNTFIYHDHTEDCDEQIEFTFGKV